MRLVGLDLPCACSLPHTLFECKHRGTNFLQGNDTDRWLQIIAQKADLLPTIAASLTRMVNAESPSLRHLVQSFSLLGHTHAESVGAQTAGNDTKLVTRGIEACAWRSLLAHTSIPKLRPSAETSAEALEDDSSPAPPTLEWTAAVSESMALGLSSLAPSQDSTAVVAEQHWQEDPWTVTSSNEDDLISRATSPTLEWFGDTRDDL